jgi:hypothetical protein
VARPDDLLAWETRRVGGCGERHVPPSEMPVRPLPPVCDRCQRATQVRPQLKEKA